MQPIGNGKVNTISIDQGGTLIRAKSYKTSGVSMSGGEHVEWPISDFIMTRSSQLVAVHKGLDAVRAARIRDKH